MNDNPKIKVKPTKFTLYIEITNYLLIFSFWILNILAFKKLPNEIPTHYNSLGEVDAYGSKETIFILPFIATVLFVILNIYAKKPHLSNYSVSITLENAEKQYKNVIKLLHVLNMFVLFIFIFIDYKTIQIGLNETDSLGSWFLPIIFISTLLIIGYFSFKSKKIK